MAFRSSAVDNPQVSRPRPSVPKGIPQLAGLTRVSTAGTGWLPDAVGPGTGGASITARGSSTPAGEGSLMGWFEVTCQTAVPVSSYDEPDDFAVTYTGEVLRRDEDNLVTTAGEYMLHRVLRGRAINHGEDMYEVCDAHSQELHEVCSAVFDQATGDFKEEVGRKFECVESDLLVTPVVASCFTMRAPAPMTRSTSLATPAARSI
jgi:hypothetical protein